MSENKKEILCSYAELGLHLSVDQWVHHALRPPYPLILSPSYIWWIQRYLDPVSDISQYNNPSFNFMLASVFLTELECIEHK